MSKLSTKLPISAVIFDRSSQGIPDVPVFASALKNKINPPSATAIAPALSFGAQAILARAGLLEEEQFPIQENNTQVPTQNHQPERSSLRADPVRGQTTGFAQSAEQLEERQALRRSTTLLLEYSKPRREDPKVRLKTVSQLSPTSSSLSEEPELVRWASDTQKLHDHLTLFSRGMERQNGMLFGPIVPRVRISPARILLLAATHQKGLVDRVIIPSVQPSIFDPFDAYLVTLRRTFWHLRLDLEQALKEQSDLKARIHQLLEELVKHVVLFVSQVRIVGQKHANDFYSTLLGLRSHIILVGYQANENRKQIVLPAIVFPSVVLPKPQFELSFLFSNSRRFVHLIRVQIVEMWSQLKTLLESLSFPSVPHIASRVLIATSLVLMLMTVGPMVALEANSWKQKIVYSLTPKANDQDSQSVPVATATPTPTPNPEPDKQFQILIPKIGVNSKVVANVDPAVEKEYSAALKQGVAHAAGTGLPGETNTHNKTIFIFGHSTNGSWNVSRYNALFYSLKDMVIGDNLSMWFWGKQFDYKVTERKIVEADDVSFLRPQTDKEQLVLQTCWPPGTTWKRLIVIAEPFSE